jgi:Fic family protein
LQFMLALRSRRASAKILLWQKVSLACQQGYLSIISGGEALQPSDFTEDAPGRLVLQPGGYWAFVPAPLPPPLIFSDRLVAHLSEADQALGQLAGVGRMLSNPHLLIRPFLRKEAVLSSQIEGTVARLEDLLLYEANPSQEQEVPDVREVANYVAALEYGLDRLQTLPVCLRLLREMHERLMQNVRGEDRRPGEFRQCQNLIGRQGQSPVEARFVPPPVTEMQTCVSELERFLGNPPSLPVLIQLALIHYQFEAIHPFMDGNGRTGRLLISLLLCERACLPKPLLSLSAYFERHRDAYMDHMLRVSQQGQWEEWLCFFLRGVAEQARDAVQRSQRLLDLWRDYRQKMQTARAPALLLQLVDALFEQIAITIPQAAKLLKVTPRSAQQNIEKLENAGVLHEVTGKARNRIYLALEIVAALEGSEQPPLLKDRRNKKRQQTPP